MAKSRPNTVGEGLGMPIATVNRTLRQLRISGSVEFRDGV